MPTSSRANVSFENQTVGWGEEVFVRFCNALVAAVASRHLGPSFVPRFTERTKAKDEGIDAVIEAPAGGDEPAGGVVGPGTTIYQFKFQDPSTERATLARVLCNEIRDKLPGILTTMQLAGRYVLLTNRDLGPGRSGVRRRVEAAIEKAAAGRPLISTVMGGAEIGALLIDYPAVGLAFGPDTILETTLDRQRSLESIARERGAPVPAAGRAAEMGSIRAFLADPSSSVLVVTGPSGIGKSTTVMAALTGSPEIAGNSYWVHGDPVSDFTRLFETLRVHRPAAVVFDEIHLDSATLGFVRRAREVPGLKSIFILDKDPGLSPLDAEALSIGEMPREDLLKIAEGAGVKDFREREWLVYLAGGNPGVLLTRAMGLKGAGSGGGAAVDLAARGLKALYQTFLDDLNVARTAGWLAVAGEVDVDDLGGAAFLAPLFGVDTSDRVALRQVLENLCAKGIARRFRSRYRFSAPFIVEPMIQEGIFPSGEKLEEAVLKVPTGYLSRLLRLLEPFQHREDVRLVAEDLIRSPLASTLELLSGNAELFVEAARIVPRLGCEHLLVLFRNEPDVLLRILGQPESWSLLRFLRESLADEAANPVALEALIEASLVDGGGVMHGRPVEGRFLLPYWTRLTWQEIPVPLSRRLEAAKMLSLAEDPRRRGLAVRCCEAALALQPFDLVSGHERLKRPTKRERAVTYAEVRTYFADVASLLRALLADPEPRVVVAAREALADGIRSLLWIRSEPAMIESVLDVLARAEDPSSLTQLLDRVSFEVEALHSEDVEDAWKKPVLTLLERFQSRLNPPAGFADLAAEIRFVFGQPLYEEAESFWGWNPGPDSETEANPIPLRRRALGAVKRSIAEPEKMTDELMRFLDSEKSQFGWLFWRLTGVLDSTGRVKLRLENSESVNAFSQYMAGRSRIAPEQVQDYLDSIAENPAKAELAFTATWRLEPSARGARRLASLIENGYFGRRAMAGWLVLGGWLTRVSVADALLVLGPIGEDPEAKGSPQVLSVVDQLVRAAPASEDIRSLGWSVVEAAPAASLRESRERISLAARLVRLGESDRGFRLIEAALLPPGGARFGWPQRELVRSELGQALAAVDRERLADLVLRAAIEDWNLSSGLMGGQGIGIVNPLRDLQLILRVIAGEPSRVRPVLSLFSGAEPGFLEMAVQIVDSIEKDLDLWSAFCFCFAFGTVIAGSSAEHLGRKAHELSEFAKGRQLGSRASEWVGWTLDYLRRRKGLDEEWEWVASFWDGKPTAGEVTSLLEKPREDESRRWFIRRLLENEKRGRARKILGDEEIAYALENDAELSPAALREWEALLRRRAPAWKS